jgi:hypothetical protein
MSESVGFVIRTATELAPCHARAPYIHRDVTDMVAKRESQLMFIICLFLNESDALRKHLSQSWVWETNVTFFSFHEGKGTEMQS